MGINEATAERLSSKRLAVEFRRSHYEDKVAGAELMKRVVDLAGLDPDEWLDKPLKRRDGSPVVGQGGTAVTVRGYLSEEAPRHPGAVKGTVSFLLMDTSDPNFEVEQRSMSGMIQERT